MKLTYKKGKQDKIHISVDGEYSFTVDEAYFLSMGIYNGKEVDSDELEEIKRIVNVRRAYNYAVSLLSRRDHSERELMTKLSQKGYADGAEEAYIANKKNNVARYESVEEAITADRALKRAWTGHPHLRIIDNSTRNANTIPFLPPDWIRHISRNIWCWIWHGAPKASKNCRWCRTKRC